MSTEQPLAARSELLALAVRRLHLEFPTVAADQVVRCVQIARDEVKSAHPGEAAAVDATGFVGIVETQARLYLAKFEAVRAGAQVSPPSPSVPTIIELGAAERWRFGRHRREAGAPKALR